MYRPDIHIAQARIDPHGSGVGSNGPRQRLPATWSADELRWCTLRHLDDVGRRHHDLRGRRGHGRNRGVGWHTAGVVRRDSRVRTPPSIALHVGQQLLFQFDGTTYAGPAGVPAPRDLHLSAKPSGLVTIKGWTVTPIAAGEVTVSVSGWPCQPVANSSSQPTSCTVTAQK